jgi:phage tail sheath protein FI
MSRPGTTITRSDTKPARTIPTSISPWFIAGITGTVDTLGAVVGPRTPCLSLNDYATRFGNRAAHATAPELYDSVEFFFKEGGTKLYVVRTTDATDPVLTAALLLFTRDLGPGQVSAPGRSTATAFTCLAVHAEATNRVAICDAPNTATVATLTALATPAGITANQERITSIFAPWVVVPGVTSGTRTIPPSGIVAGLMAKNDSAGVNPNQPSAGQLGQSAYASDASFAYIDVDRTTLNANGINLLKLVAGSVRVYGYRTLADPSVALEANYLQLSNARLYMRIQAELDAIGERFIFRQIDGQRLTINEYGGVLTGALLPYWQRGSLYGTNPEDAFRVDVGPNINTDVTIANGDLRASIMLRMSPFAEEVFMDLVKTKITEAI